MNLKEQLLKIKEMLMGFKQSGSIEKTIDTNEGNIRIVISNKFSNISLDSKVDDFILWYFKNMVKGYYRKIGEYWQPIDLRNFIEKMAVWYELRYPEYEVNRLMPCCSCEEIEISDVMFNENKYINESFDEDSLVRILNWQEFYNTNAFINSLPHEERRFFKKPQYRNLVYLNPNYRGMAVSPHLSLTTNGFVRMSEGLGIYGIDDKKIKGMHVKEVLNLLKENGIKLPSDNELEKAISDFEKENYFKEELLNSVMYRIIERGGTRIGARRAFLFAKEFKRNIDIPMMYGIDPSDPGLRNFIFEYLKAGGSKDLICYVAYFSKRNDLKNIKTATIEEILKLKNNYTKEENELHQKLVNVLNSGINHEELEKERVKLLRIERKLEKSRKR